MTGTKKVTFEQDQLPGVDDIEFELSYSYSYKPAKTSGDPNSCYDSEEESEITLPDGWEATVMLAYIKAAREAIKHIEFSLIPDMNFDNKPRQWAEEERNY